MWQHVKDWWNKPYDDNMTVIQWFWFFGFIIVLSVLWTLVLREITRAASAISA
jgi:hypothetical protein